MDWADKQGHKRIHEAVVSVLRKQSPNRANMTYLITHVMNYLRPTTPEFMSAYNAVSQYIHTNTGRGKALSFHAGIGGGYAVKPSATAKARRVKRKLDKHT